MNNESCKNKRKDERRVYEKCEVGEKKDRMVKKKIKEEREETQAPL